MIQRQQFHTKNTFVNNSLSKSIIYSVRLYLFSAECLVLPNYDEL